MPVRVDEAVGVHEAEILRLVVGAAARGKRLGDEAVDLLAAFATEREQHLDRLARVADLFRREVPELRVRGKHEGNRIADMDARSAVAGERRVHREAKRGEEGRGPLEVGDREVDEDLPAHEYLLRRVEGGKLGPSVLFSTERWGVRGNFSVSTSSLPKAVPGSFSVSRGGVFNSLRPLIAGGHRPRSERSHIRWATQFPKFACEHVSAEGPAEAVPQRVARTRD